MYRTRKYRLLITSSQAKILKCYKNTYHFELRRLEKMAKRRKIYMKDISDEIHKYSKYYMLKIIDGTYGTLDKKVALFHRSSFAFCKQAIILYFGENFIVSQMEIALACDSNEWDYLMNYQIIRLDLLYDGEWYVNIVIVEYA